MTKTNRDADALVPEADETVETSVLAALKNPRRLKTEVLAGLLVAIALIPEAISFSIIAGVDPKVGLFSSFVMAVTIAFVGGRPAMITAATGAIALVIAPVNKEYGFNYFLATVLLGGLLQIVMAVLGVAKLMRFIPRMVMVGFVNALAILIFIAQLPQLIGPDIPWIVYPMVALGLAVIYLFPLLTKAIPSGLIAIIVVTTLVALTGWEMPTVGDEGTLPDSLPEFFFPDVPWTFETLQIIAPYAFAMALVGLMESLMTAKLVDSMTDTHSNKTRESWGQGVANIASGLFGGMGGCAMIGQTTINVKASGARTRISTFLAGVFLLILVVGLGDLVAQIPMAVLVAIMIMVCISTFDWHSIQPKTLKRMPYSETIVMLVTVISTVATNNLAVGVILGVLTASLVFVRRVNRFTTVEKVTDDNPDVQVYRVRGELFFVSSNDLVYQFDYKRDPDHVIIDMSQSNIWDASTVASLDAVENKYAKRGKIVEIVGLNKASKYRHSQLSGHLNEQ